jgi:hypothetical protein
MAISDSQKVDYLWKKIAYGKTKTDLGTAKQGFEESISSPLLVRGDRIWQQSGSIPASISTPSSVVTVYSGSTTVECTEDLTAADNRTWKTNLTDWISPEFGADYLISVYIANSGITGSNKATQVTIAANKITAAGVTSPTALDDQWYFDYQSGVLHFIGTNIPSAITTNVTGKSIYITGARYTGDLGFGNSSSVNITTANLGNLSISGNTITSINSNDNINIDPNGTGNLVITGNIIADYYYGDGSHLTGLTAGALSGTANLNAVNINSSGDSNYGAISLGNATIAANTTSGAAGIFTGIGSSAISNITIGTSSSTVKVPGTLSAGSITGNNSNITITTNTLIDSFAVGTYRTAKYIITVSNSTTYEALEALVIHDGSDSYITVYGYISSDDSDIVSVSTDISGGNVNLYASRMVAVSTTLNYLATYIKD